MAHYGVGELTAPVILAELGDVAWVREGRSAETLQEFFAELDEPEGGDSRRLDRG
jgi:hypothetical protein